MSDEQDWAPSEDLGWGPKRPPAVSWSGALLFLLGLANLVVVGIFTYIDWEAILARRADQIVMGSVLALFALQMLAAVAVFRLWRWWRGIAIALSACGAALAVVNVPRVLHVPMIGAVLGIVAFLYVIVIVLLARSRAAFA